VRRDVHPPEFPYEFLSIIGLYSKAMVTPRVRDNGGRITCFRVMGPTCLATVSLGT
jgi:hypothetical protein